MLEAFSRFIMAYLDPIGIVVGLILAVPVIWSWAILLGNRRRQKELIKNIQQTQGDRPAALVVSVGPGDVTNQVRAFLQDSDSCMELKSVQLAALNKDNVSKFVTALRKARAELMTKGVGKLHLFYFGPVTGAMCLAMAPYLSITTIATKASMNAGDL